MRISLRLALPAGALVAAAALVMAGLNGFGATTRLAAASGAQAAYRSVCPPAKPGHFTCLSIVRTGASPQVLRPDALPAGFSPTGLRSAYNLTSATAGSGRTVAIVDAFDDPKAASDLATYRSVYGLPACTTLNGCFRKVNQSGGSTPPAPNSGWAVEISLDLDMVSAICPTCHILLVEANSDRVTDLGASVQTAVNLGAKYVSNSYGAPELKGEATTFNHFFNHPGVAVTFAAGDFGYGVDYPAASRYVTAVGGTSLRRATNARGWSERAWAGTGSGCSAYSAKPAWQPTKSGCPTRRTVADVAAVADPNTAVAIYDTYPDPGLPQLGWNRVGGTSVATPIIAAVYARSALPAANTYAASYPYRHRSFLWDIVGGSNGSCTFTYLCTAVTGYDGPTGTGTPNSSAAFKY